MINRVIFKNAAEGAPNQRKRQEIAVFLGDYLRFLSNYGSEYGLQSGVLSHWLKREKPLPGHPVFQDHFLKLRSQDKSDEDLTRIVKSSLDSFAEMKGLRLALDIVRRENNLILMIR